VDQDEKVIFKATPASTTPYFDPGDFGPGAGSRPMIRSRAQMRFRSRYQLMLITV
jgi:hypothetical protein